MRLFLLKIGFFFLPFGFVFILYMLIDPFGVMATTPDIEDKSGTYLLPRNKDVYSTQLFLNQYKKCQYNAFIMGNSRSIFFPVEVWGKYVKANHFHYDASRESLFGIEKKLLLLDELDVSINYVLLILDSDVLKQTKNSSGVLYVKHPRVSKESSLSFHEEMFRGFFSKSFLAYVDFYFTKKYKPYMQLAGIQQNKWVHHKESNQWEFSEYEQQLSINPSLYYQDKMHLFYKRDSVLTYETKIIAQEQKVLLSQIKSIFAKHKTNFKIVISPMYNQMKLNRSDIAYLQAQFGKNNVFDFSGINSMTQAYTNFYEPLHYRPHIASQIMKQVYGIKN